MVIHLIELVDFEFIYHIDPARNIHPARMYELARTALERGGFPEKVFEKLNEGNTTCSGATPKNAILNVMSRIADDLKPYSSSGAVISIGSPPANDNASVYWRPVGHIHQVIGLVLEQQGAATPTRVTVDLLESDGSKVGTAEFCCRAYVRALAA